MTDKPQSLALKVKVKMKSEGGAKLPPVHQLPRLLTSLAKAGPKRKVRFGE